MIKRQHVIQGGRVVNTISVDDRNPLTPAPGTVLIDAAAGGRIGDLWDGVNFTTPPPGQAEKNDAAAQAIVILELPSGFTRRQREYLIANSGDATLTQRLGAVDAAIAIERAKILPLP